uniref:Uncharacterized protein n=1 Tax=Anopheles dirus TaxID=7168 RepID=A0A182NDS7_9DIPT
MREDARIAIDQAQRRYKEQFDKKRKPALGYNLGELVAIKRTQYVAGRKLASEYLGPYEVVQVNRKGRYRVRKEGNGEGPVSTSTSDDNMKLWAYATTIEEEEDEDQGSDFNQDGRITTLQVYSGSPAARMVAHMFRTANPKSTKVSNRSDLGTGIRFTLSINPSTITSGLPNRSRSVDIASLKPDGKNSSGPTASSAAPFNAF